MFTNNKFKQLDAVAEMIKGIADADAKVKMDEMRGIIAGHNKMEVPVAKGLEEYSFINESDTSVKIDTPTGTRVLGHRYGNAAKTHRDSMSDPFAVVRGPNKKDIEALEKKKVKKEAVDPTDTTTDTLSGRVKGGAPNQHSSFKVKLKAEEMEKEELVGKQHKLDKNKNGKLDSQDFKMLRKEELEELMEYGPSATAALRQGQQPIQVAAADRKDQENTLNIKRSAMKAQQDVAKGLDPTQTAAGQRMAEGFNKLTPQQKAHEYNLDSAQREMDSRHAQGEDMTGAKIDKKTYKIVKPKQQGVAEGSFSDMDVQKKDKQYAGTQAYNAKKKVEKEKTAGAAKTTFRAKFGLVKKEEDEELDEASYINGKETSNEPKWKMTGLSHGDAIKKHGEDKVKKVQSRNRSGDLTGGHHVEVLMKEGIGLDEAKSNYELYHPTYSGAIHHALAHHASKSGLSVSDDDYHHHVSIGPRKPTEGVSVSHSLPATDENGGKHMIHMQIYNRGGDKKPFELNTYCSKIAKTSGRTMKEEVEELDENFEAGSLVENYEMINEVSLGAKIKAYAHHHSNAFEHGDMGNDDEAEHHSDRADKIIKHIARHHGPEAVKHAEKAAHSAIFGRDDPHGHGDGGNDVLHGGLRGNQNDLSGLSKNTTKAGTIPKNTQKAMKNKIMAYGKHRNTGGPKGHLPEEVELVFEGSGPKEKQKSPYVDRNSTESKAKIQAARDKMAKDKAAEPGKKMLSKMKEDTELDERTLSPAEKDALEVNVMSMKKNLAGFKARYGKDAKSVMYATATKQAKKD